MDEPILKRKRSLMDKSVKEQRKILVIATFFLVTLFFGSSYALLTNFNKTQNNVVNVSTGELKATVVTDQDITLNGKIPETDESGLQNANAVKVTITNTGTIAIAKYQIKLIQDENQTSTLSDEYVRFAISFDGTNYTIAKNLYSESNVINIGYDIGTTNGTTTRIIYVKAWIDKNAESNGVNKSYHGSLKLDLSSSINKISASELITNIKTNNLKADNNSVPLNYVKEGNVTYLSGCSKYYFNQGVDGCTKDNLMNFNYVWYSGRMWRITSFDESTNTIKLITEESQTSVAWHDSSTNFSDAYVKQFLNDEFYDSLYNSTNVIDTSIQWNATATTSESSIPNTTMISSNVGLLNSYEYYNSYQKVGSSNKYDFGYLNIGQYSVLINAYDSSYVWFVYSSGKANKDVPTDSSGIRPSINLLSSISFTGRGTEDDPYKIVGDKSVGERNDNLNTRQVGEYVKLKSGVNEQMFRIVGFENNTTKLVTIDYVKENNQVLQLPFATSNTNGDGTLYGEGNTVGNSSNQTWYYYLTNTYITDLKTKYGSSMFTTGEYYLGINANNPTDTTVNYNYRTSICSSTSNLTKNCEKSRSKSLEVGLLRYGEMFAAQNGIISKLATDREDIWLLTRLSNIYVIHMFNSSYLTWRTPDSSFAVLPSINLSSSVKILSGSGLPNDPYIVGIPS